MLDVELSAKAVPESRGELWATVRGDGGGNSEAGNPVVNEGRCTLTGISGGGGEGNGLRPTGGMVNDGEEMGMLGGGGERAKEIHVNV